MCLKKNNGTLSYLMINDNQVGFIPAKNFIRPVSPIITDEIIVYANTIYLDIWALHISLPCNKKLSSEYHLVLDDHVMNLFAYVNIEGNCPSELEIGELPFLKFSMNDIDSTDVDVVGIFFSVFPMRVVGKAWKINTAVNARKEEESSGAKFDPLHDHFIPISIPCRIVPPDPSKLQRVISHVSPGIMVEVARNNVYLRNTSIFCYPKGDHLWFNSDPNNSSLENQRVYVRFNNIKFHATARCPGARDGYGNFVKWFILKKYYSHDYNSKYNGIGDKFGGTPAYYGAGNTDSFYYEAGKTVEIWAYSYQDAKASGLFPNIDSMEENKCYIL